MVTKNFLNQIMGNVFGMKKTPPLPTKYFLGLSKSAPNVDGTGVTEPTGGGYTRMELTMMSEPTDGVIDNQEGIMFPVSTDDWGTVTHYVIYDASGNVLRANQLKKPRAVQSDIQFYFTPHALKISLLGD